MLFFLLFFILFPLEENVLLFSWTASSQTVRQEQEMSVITGQKKIPKKKHIPRQLALPLSLQDAREAVICVCDCRNSVPPVLQLFQTQHLWPRRSVTAQEGGSRLRSCLCFPSSLLTFRVLRSSSVFPTFNPARAPQQVIITAGSRRRRACLHVLQVSAVRSGSRHF